MLLALGPAVLFAAATLSLPPFGDYHEGTTLDCAECHRMHPDRPAEPWKAGMQGAGSWVGRLLKEDVNDLCLSCHDAGQAADVLGPNQGKDPAAVRQAGALNRLGRVGLPATGHTLDSLDTAPGSQPPWRPEQENGAGMGLNCINCHAPHGSQHQRSAYRNLRSDAGNNSPGDGLVTYNSTAGVNDLSRDVFVRRALHYDEREVDLNEPDPTDSAMGRYCAGCHDSFHGAPGTPQIGGRPGAGGRQRRFLRHPTAGVSLRGTPGSGASLSRFAAHRNRIGVMSEVGVWDPPGPDVTLTCTSCHRGHGNRNPFGLIFRSGTGVPTEEGDTGGTSVEHLCGQCHGEAASL